MNPRDLHDDALLASTKKLVRQERELVTEILRHLREVERRRLFSKLKYKSLHEYAVKELCYSDGQAQRRISAMRLMTEIPELENKLNSGATNLSNVGLVHSYFRHESKLRPISKIEKSEVLAKIEHLSTRQAELVVASMSNQPETLFAEKVRVLTTEFSEIKFSADQALLDKIENLKGLLAHKLPQASFRELFHELCDIGLAQLSAPVKRRSRNSNPTNNNIHIVDQNPRLQAKKHSNYLCCEICSSTFALQIDHVIPKAKGGSDDKSNRRLLCRSCNQRAAIEHFGQRKMEKYLNEHR